MIKTKFLFFLIFVSFTSCINSSSESSDKTVYICFKDTSKESDLSFEILGGENVEVLDLSQSFNVYKVHFNSVGGGSNYILGYRYKHVHGDTSPRLLISKFEKNLKKLSLNEILEMDFEIIEGRKVYKIDLTE